MDWIWDTNISRETLLHKITLLAILGPVPEEPRRHRLAQTSVTRHIWTIHQEAEVAGNLAFLSRRSLESHNVAAIGLEEDDDGRGMVVRVAVNGSMLQSVTNGLMEICHDLEAIARGVNSVADDIELLLQQVVKVDFSRIATRLRLRKKYPLASSPFSKLRIYVEKDLANSEVLNRVNELLHMTQNLKNGSLFPAQLSSRKAVQKMLRLTYELVSSPNLLAVLDRNKRNASGTDITSTIDGLMKIGHYYRATRQLVLAARRKNCHLFQNIRVTPFDIRVPSDIRKPTERSRVVKLTRTLAEEVDKAKLLESFNGSESMAVNTVANRLSSARFGLKVHAEIKLLVFYECNPSIQRPRIIAVSKSSCYLCNLFFHIHGGFQVTATFGKFNERWILPDWIIPSHGKRLGESVQQFDRELSNLLHRSINDRRRLPQPVESLIGLSASWPSLNLSGGSISDHPRPPIETLTCSADAVLAASLREAASESITTTDTQRVASPASPLFMSESETSLPFSQSISLYQRDIHVDLGNFQLAFEFTDVSSGNLQIRRHAGNYVSTTCVIDVMEVPTDSELVFACPQDKPRLSLCLKLAENTTFVLDFDWGS